MKNIFYYICDYDANDVIIMMKMVFSPFCFFNINTYCDLLLFGFLLTFSPVSFFFCIANRAKTAVILVFTQECSKGIL